MEDENLCLILERLKEPDFEIRQNALSMLIDFVKSSHSGSINTISFQSLNDKKHIIFELCSKVTSEQSKVLYDILSAISIMGEDTDILRFRIKGNVVPLKEWGHLYTKKLIGCIIDSKHKKNSIPFEATRDVSNSCVDFLFKNNLEFDAIDFLLDIDCANDIIQFVLPHNYKRIVLYLEEVSKFIQISDLLKRIYIKMSDHSRLVVYLIDTMSYKDVIQHVSEIKDEKLKFQLLYILARSNVYYETESQEEKNILSNLHVKDIYRNVIGIFELDSSKSKFSNVRRLRYDKGIKEIQQASFNPITVSNGFTHFGFGQDGIFFPKDNNSIETLDCEAILNSDIPELITIMGSVGCIEFWNPNKILEILQEYIFGESSTRKTGSLLALALSSSKIYDDNKTILSLLTNNLQSNDPIHVIPTLLGIQSMYSGTADEELNELIQPLLFSEFNEISFFAAFTLGSIFVGTADDKLTSIFLQMFIEKEEFGDSHFFKLLMLGLGLLFYKRADVECCLAGIDGTYSRHGSILLRGFQHIKTGDPQIVESILSDSFTGETDALLESIALLSCTLVGLGDDLATQTISRIATSSLLLDSPHLKSVLPLCYSLLYASSPQQGIIDVLEKSLNSGDSNTIVPSIYALGIVGAGTVNGRIQKILDQQYSYFYKDSKASTMLKISQGLLSLGKGLISLSPMMYDKALINTKSFIGLFVTTILMLDPLTSPLINGQTYLYYLLCQSCNTKYIHCDTKLNIRIGLPVSTVGVVGDPRRITSMQTHFTPVTINSKERAEIDEHCYTSYIEDVVVLKEN